MRGPKLIVFDLDGTLLTDTGQLSPKIKEFLHEIQGKLTITLATGRSLASAKRYIQELSIAFPVILFHGAIIWDPVTNRTLREKRIPLDVAAYSLQVLSTYPLEAQVYLSTDEPVVHVQRMTPAIMGFLTKEGLRAEEVGDLAQAISQPPLKILAIGNRSTLRAIVEDLRDRLSQVAVTQSEQSYLELLPWGVSKGEALSWLCRKTGLQPESVVAVGDQMSDLSMIEWAGFGVAMRHAPDELRCRARAVIQTIAELRELLPTELLHRHRGDT